MGPLSRLGCTEKLPCRIDMLSCGPVPLLPTFFKNQVKGEMKSSGALCENNKSSNRGNDTMKQLMYVLFCLFVLTCCPARCPHAASLGPSHSSWPWANHFDIGDHSIAIRFVLFPVCLLAISRAVRHEATCFAQRKLRISFLDAAFATKACYRDHLLTYCNLVLLCSSLLSL